MSNTNNADLYAVLYSTGSQVKNLADELNKYNWNGSESKWAQKRSRLVFDSDDFDTPVARPTLINEDGDPSDDRVPLSECSKWAKYLADTMEIAASYTEAGYFYYESLRVFKDGKVEYESRTYKAGEYPEWVEENYQP